MNMHTTNTAGRLRRVLVTLLSLSLAFGGMPIVAGAAPTTAVSYSVAPSASGWFSGDVVATLTGADTATQIRYALTGATSLEATASAATTDVPVSAEGTTTLWYRAYNGDTALEATGSVPVQIDKGKPTDATVADLTYWGSAKVRITGTDAVSGVEKIEYRIDSAAPTTSVSATTAVDVVVSYVASPLTHQIDYALFDKAGNVTSGSKSFEVKVADSQVPTTTISGAGVNSGWVKTSSVTFSLNATDGIGNSGVKATYWRLNKTGAYTAGTSSSVTLEGTTTVEYYSIDNANNTEASKVATIQIDRSGPTLSSNRLPAYSSAATIRIAASDLMSGVASMSYRLDAALTTTTVNAVSAVNVGPVSGTGAHTLTFSAADAVGNTSSSVVTFTIDPTAPTTTIAYTPSTYVPSTWSSSIVSFSLTATDTPTGSGLAGIRFRVDGSAAATYTAPYAVSTDGTHTIDFWSVDIAGNKENTQTVTVKVDRTKPSSTSDAKASYLSPASIAITPTDAHSGVANTYWSIDGALATAGTTAMTSVAGTHTLDFWAVDAAGNKEDTHTVVFHVTGQPGFVLGSKSAYLNNTRNPAPVSVTAWLKDGATPIGGRRVVLQYSPTSSFAVKGSVNATTAASGWVRFNRNISSRTYFRIVFAGDADYAATTSTVIAYVPKAALSIPLAKSPQRARRAFTVTGKIVPAHAKGRRVKIERYQIVGKKRVYRGYTWTTITPKGSYSLYSARLTLAKGTWLLRAVAPYDTAHALTASGFRTISVR
jgi:hypothetical protein